MSQVSSMVVANQAGAAFRAAVNLVHQALASCNSGATQPTETRPYMLWADTTSGVMKIRNAADSAWIEMFKLSAPAQFKDNLFALTDDADETKKAVFQLAGLTTALTRTLTLQDKSLTVAGIDVPQIFTATQVPDNAAGTVNATGNYAFDGTDQIRKVTLTNAITVTFTAPTNIVEHAMYKFVLVAGDANARTFAWNAAYKFPDAVPPLTSGVQVSGALDVITFIGGASNTLIYDGHNAGLR